MRLNRYLAAAGQGSRRGCEELILSGQVTINGVACTSLSTNVEANDVVKVRNKVMLVARPVTLLLHKPPGFLCTASDTHERRTIFDLLPPNFPRLFHVGRLDMESEGLLLVTNDGDLSLNLTHPRYKVEKEYEVVLNMAFDYTLAPKMIKGFSTPEGHARAVAVHKISNNKVKVVLRQGLKRQIRLMFYALGYEVTKLSRTRIGPISIQNMPPGSWRELTQREIKSLLDSRREEVAASPLGSIGSTPKNKPKNKLVSRKPADAKPKAAKAPASPKRGSKGGDDDFDASDDAVSSHTWEKWDGEVDIDWNEAEANGLGAATEERKERSEKTARPERPTRAPASSAPAARGRSERPSGSSAAPRGGARGTKGASKTSSFGGKSDSSFSKGKGTKGLRKSASGRGFSKSSSARASRDESYEARSTYDTPRGEKPFGRKPIGGGGKPAAGGRKPTGGGGKPTGGKSPFQKRSSAPRGGNRGR